MTETAVPAKKKLRRLRQLLVNSRFALERASSSAKPQWLGDLLFTLSCRRVIMLNELDRELGQMHVPVTPYQEDEHFQDLPEPTEAPKRFVQVCQEEERYLERELESMKMEAGLHGHTRDAIGNLLREIRANLNDILFLRENHSALQS